MIDNESERLEVLKQIPPLMPRFLRRRRMGLPAVRELMSKMGLEHSVYFWLVRFHELQGSYGWGPVSLGQMRARQPYTTKHNFEEPLRVLTEKGLILQDEPGEFFLSPDALIAINGSHDAAREYVAALRLLPDDALEQLVVQLEHAVDGIMSDQVLAPRPGSHMAGSHSLSVVRESAPLMVRVEQAIFDLWMARDDAHIKAWTNAGLDGPVVAVLTSLWYARSLQLADLQAAFSTEQTPNDIENDLIYLVENEYVTREGETVQLTPRGVLLREDIERETDRIYFAPWPQTTPEARDMLSRLTALVDELDRTRQG